MFASRHSFECHFANTSQFPTTTGRSSIPFLLLTSLILLLPQFSNSLFVPSKQKLQFRPWAAPSSVTATAAASSSDNDLGMMDAPDVLQNIIITTCKYCEHTFSSRNALFRHVRSNPDCTAMFLQESGQVAMDHLSKNAPRRGVALLLGYTSNDSTFHASEAAAKAVEEAFVARHSCSELKISQASAVDHRHRALAQDQSCAAAGDVITLRYRSTMDVGDNLVQELNQQLQGGDNPNLCVCVLGMERLSALASHMSAEQDSTQIAYHYLVPLSWLPDGEAANKWWFDEKQRTLHKKEQIPNDNMMVKWKRIRFGAKIRDEMPHSCPPPSSLKLWKEALKSAASMDTREAKEGTAPSVTAGKPRFRGLDGKEKRCWHNFADPSLQGDASPNNTPVWRTLDRARTIEFFENQNNAAMVVELRGDGFVTQQVRRIIGTAMAMVHGWLPNDFFDIATKPDVFLETPIAPEGYMFLAGARFDFNEVQRMDIMFGASNGRQREWIEELQFSILDRHARETTSGKAWLDDLRDVVAPRIRLQLQQLADDEAYRKARSAGIMVKPIFAKVDSTELQLYEQTLTLLRDIVKSGKWPATSIARARVIRSGDHSLQTQSGSFTVVNRARLAANDKVTPYPLANQLFPDLANAVFSLEQHLVAMAGSSVSSRIPSTHCAVNCNAEFTPHIDSGRGAGQSLSMIVGLGDYSGGGLMVEGMLHDIHYRVLEFDGWKLRHWTEPFEGERFSLVWFTPE